MRSVGPVNERVSGPMLAASSVIRSNVLKRTLIHKDPWPHVRSRRRGLQRGRRPTRQGLMALLVLRREAVFIDLLQVPSLIFECDSLSCGRVRGRDLDLSVETGRAIAEPPRRAAGAVSLEGRALGDPTGQADVGTCRRPRGTPAGGQRPDLPTADAADSRYV